MGCGLDSGSPARRSQLGSHVGSSAAHRSRISEAEELDKELKPALRIVYRSIGMTIVSALGYALFAACLVYYAFQDIPIAVAAIFAVFGAIALYLAVFVRSGIVATAAGVEVRALWRTHFAAWDNIAGFTKVHASALNSSVYIAVRLNDGTVLKSPGLTSSKNGRFGGEVMAELQRLLGDAKQRPLAV